MVAVLDWGSSFSLAVYIVFCLVIAISISIVLDFDHVCIV
jgi:hypothetical protein